MVRIDNVYLIENYEHERDHPEKNPFFKDKIVIKLSYVYASPEKTWPSDAEQIRYSHEQNGKLKALGILTEKVLAYFREQEEKGLARGIEVFAEFKELQIAEQTFERAMECGIVDIYLYQNGELINKYD